MNVKVTTVKSILPIQVLTQELVVQVLTLGLVDLVLTLGLVDLVLIPVLAALALALALIRVLVVLVLILVALGQAAQVLVRARVVLVLIRVLVALTLALQVLLAKGQILGRQIALNINRLKSSIPLMPILLKALRRLKRAWKIPLKKLNPMQTRFFKNLSVVLCSGLILFFQPLRRVSIRWLTSHGFQSR
ncbi:hypothetical protein AA957_29400 [Pseudomonas trivialis]|uniref:Uncharacterized protein n=1 Tax=Pseudomonas trivialis TaxID=200450 RepID=A0A0H5AIJ4_9PSED|nr:hypothetical protein AA957_00050 [Pseudomonas trivialis]AKS04585.1 hypothetical protein AA957_00095 [Pseudomonas trivialis]AKS10053.1 hypothetical protein AA957_29400 [Pseudomonas trivialis]